MNSVLKSVSFAVLLGSAQALTPDGGNWHHPGSPFIVTDQTPTRYVGQSGTKLQCDPYGMPSYGQLHRNAYQHDDGFTGEADFQRPPRGFQRPGPSHSVHRYTSAAGNAAGSSQNFHRRRPSAPPPPTQEPGIPEFERQRYVRIKEDFRNINDHGEEEDYFFAGRPHHLYDAPGFEQTRPVFFQDYSTDFFTGRPSTGFHNRPIRPNFY